MNTLALDYKARLSEETLDEISNIVARRAHLINISLPVNEFVLLSEILREKDCRVFSLGIHENNETESTSTKVLLGRECLKTMEQFQLKRPIDLIHVTPAVENSIKRLRKALVLEELKNGNAYKVIGKNQARILEKPLLSIVDPNANYKYINSPTLQNITDGILPIDTRALEKALKALGQVFIESIITNGNNFVLVTQLDIFLSNQAALDDCAYLVQDRYLTSFYIDLKQKTRFKTSWNELIIQNGRFQILVTGGLFGTYGTSTCQPFLSSSFPFTFSDDIFTCYININDIRLKSQQRYLIDYKKMSANLLAGFISQRFSILGLEAAHPLYYSNAVPVGRKPHLSHIVSRILCHYSLNSCTSNDVIDILNLLLKTDTFMKLIKNKNQSKRCRD